MTEVQNPSPQPPENMSVTEKWCNTDIEVLSINYTWTINKFSFCLEKNGTVLSSSTFSAGANEFSKWRLNIYPKGINKNVTDYLSVYLCLMSSIKEEVGAKFKISILNARKETSRPAGDGWVLHKFTKSEDWGFAQFIKRDRLFDNANGLLPDDKLMLHCEIAVVGDIVNASGQSNSTQFAISDSHVSSDDLRELSDDFGGIFEVQSFSDVTLSVSEKEFQVHKAILAARSPVFAAMFEHKMKETKHNFVEILDIEYEVLREMLRFIYTGRTTNLEEMADNLMAAADKYALGKLKLRCEEALCKKLNTENAAKFLILADLHSAGKLKAQAIQFINMHAVDVKETQGWKSMIQSHPRIIAEEYMTLATQQIIPIGPPKKKEKTR